MYVIVGVKNNVAAAAAAAVAAAANDDDDGDDDDDDDDNDDDDINSSKENSTAVYDTPMYFPVLLLSVGGTVVSESVRRSTETFSCLVEGLKA
ncbi:hypothetical protein PoB_007560100 [Plakobranchus ocellatus]|uniref:Uncharacterized protein n=1 Tax=Plakobranchus ocellatus TaxID=259542 RepID=A0AAV4DZ31_9GAST|nr:hypothetical protein PoB_007560100 [Plakobranchus ocellatus]